VSAPFVSYAQHGEDVVLWRALHDTPDGTYVDVGAFDPSDDSVTRAFYERGWRGINIEAQRDRITTFDRERPDETNVWAAASSSEGTATLIVPANEGWASINAGVSGEFTDTHPENVPRRTLATVLREHAVTKVDFLKIDVEGAEADVVRGMDLTTVRPRVIVVEGVAPVIGRTAGDEAVRLLTEAGYRHCMFDGLNHYLTDDDDLVEALSVPANPLDNYVPARYGALLADREQLIGTIDRLVSERESLAAQDQVHPAAAEQPEVDVPTRAAPADEVPDPAAAVVAVVGGVGEDAADVAYTPAADRAARRRRLFLAHLGGRLVFRATEARPVGASERVSILDALAATEPEQIIEGLYRAILRRPSDTPGLAAWSDRVTAGHDPAALAFELLTAPEARAFGDEHRIRIEKDLQKWAAMQALHQLGVRVDGITPRTAGTAAQEIFVAALYQGVLHRLPNPTELDLEVAKLRAGVGREWMIRAFARRPEASHLFLDIRSRTAWARAGRWVRRRWFLYSRVRDLVLAAESREISRLMMRATRTADETSQAVHPPTEVS
jgi:FkbM family methyltransferase